MKRLKKWCLTLTVALTALTANAGELQKPTEIPRILISTDIGGTDPDDNQSIAHLMMYTDLFDLEGLVSSPSFGSGSAKEIFRMIDVFEKDYPVLRRHAKVMAPDELRPLVKQGRTSELPPCGFDKPTEGSDWIVKCARKDDPRPLYVLVWGCLEDVAQALHDANDYPLGNHWYSDLPDRSEYEGKWQGAKTQRKWRQAILEDWARRWNWLKE
jgi:hypothetical protein